MRKLLIIPLLAFSLACLGAGCSAAEDTSVKEAPADIPTSTADQIGSGKQKDNGESGPADRSGG